MRRHVSKNGFLAFLALHPTVKAVPCTEPTQCAEWGNNGVFLPNPCDCSTFYQCAYPNAVFKHCGPGTYFDPETLVCTWEPKACQVCDYGFTFSEDEGECVEVFETWADVQQKTSTILESITAESITFEFDLEGDFQGPTPDSGNLGELNGADPTYEAQCGKTEKSGENRKKNLVFQVKMVWFFFGFAAQNLQNVK